MFCPNCGAKNKVEQNFCRGCGLKLGGIVTAVSEQFPSREFLEMQRRTENFQRIGAVCLAIAGVVGFSLLLFKAAEYKAELFGPEVLLWSAIGALIGFLLLSAFFFNYPKFFRANSPLVSASAGGTATVMERAAAEGQLDTAKLLEDRPSDYVSSVTEETTRNLKVPRSSPGN